MPSPRTSRLLRSNAGIHPGPRSAPGAAFIELKLDLAAALRARRRQRRLTQWDLAKLVKSSQSRVAKMESAHPSVSLDLLVRTLLALGASSGEIARTLAPRRSAGALRD